MTFSAYLQRNRLPQFVTSAIHPGNRSHKTPRLTAWFLATLAAAALACSMPAALFAQEKEAAKPAAGAEKAASKTAPAKPTWKPLFDGKSLHGWKVTKFGGEGEVTVRDGMIELGMGSPLTGITYTEKTPKCNYELQVEAMRIDGNDFFSAITFPVNDSFCSLVVGGWGGGIVGISCIDGFDASENETTKFMQFESKKWYRMRIQVRKEHINAWIDDKQVVDVDIKGRKLSTRSEVTLSEPMGIASYITRAGIRKIELRELPPEARK